MKKPTLIDKYDRLEVEHARLEGEHTRLQARFDTLAAKLYQAQADYEQAKEQCAQLTTTSCDKQYVIKTLLHKSPNPTLAKLQRLHELSNKLAA